MFIYLSYIDATGHWTYIFYTFCLFIIEMYLETLSRSIKLKKNTRCLYKI